MASRLTAYWLLGWSLVRTWLKRWFGTGLTGLRLFEANFSADRLVSLTPDERARMPRFSRCIACGRCNEGDAPFVQASGGAYPGTMALMLSCSRNMPDFDLAAPAFAWISNDALAAKERLCPTGVPMREIAAFVRRSALSEQRPAG